MSQGTMSKQDAKADTGTRDRVTWDDDEKARLARRAAEIFHEPGGKVLSHRQLLMRAMNSLPAGRRRQIMGINTNAPWFPNAFDAAAKDIELKARRIERPSSPSSIPPVAPSTLSVPATDESILADLPSEQEEEEGAIMEGSPDLPFPVELLDYDAGDLLLACEHIIGNRLMEVRTLWDSLNKVMSQLSISRPPMPAPPRREASREATRSRMFAGSETT